MVSRDKVKLMASFIASGFLSQLQRRQDSVDDLTYDDIVQDSVEIAMKIDLRVDEGYPSEVRKRVEAKREAREVREEETKRNTGAA